MYFWKIEKLKKDLLKKPLSESESFKYLFANMAMYSLGTIPFPKNNIWDIYLAIIMVPITALGVYYAYRCNGGTNGSNFLQKYLSIGWVVFIRWFVLVMFPAIAIYALIMMAMFTSIQNNTTLFDAIFFNLLYISYFWLFGKHIKGAAK